MRFHKPVLTPQQTDTNKQARVAADAARAAEAAAQATEDRIADWVLAQLREGRTLGELIRDWSTEEEGIDLAALVDRRLGIDIHK